MELDVSDDTSVEAGVKTVLAEAGKIDVLVNNAGIASAGVTEAFTTEQAKAIFDILDSNLAECAFLTVVLDEWNVRCQ